MNKTEFTNIYQTHYQMLFRYVYRLSKNEELARDICQDTFMKFYMEWSKGKKIEAVKSWIFKCATNQFLNSVKRGQIIQFEQYSHKSDIHDSQTPERKYLKDEWFKNFESVLDKLNSNEKQLVYLYQEEFSYAEISQITGIKITSVGKTLSRTIQKVSDQLHKIKCYELP